MKGLLFFLVLLVIGFILWSTSKKEGFEDTPETPEGASPGPVIPLISPREQTLLKGEVQPFTDPTTSLLAPPPGQIASVGTKPAEDPATEKASAGRIQSVHESLLGFFEKDAPGLQRLGDPSVQLPLTTARGDRGRLEDELAVLKRNPGLQSSLTVQDVNEIEANLAYLQKKWRQSVNAMSGSPMPGGAEGFQNASASSGPGGVVGWFTSLFNMGDSGPQEGFQAASGTASGAASGTTTGTGSDLKLQDLQDLSLKINVEILRLQSTGTTDINTNARIDVLVTIKKTIDDLIKEVQRGIRRESDIPIKKSDVAKFLPAMTNLNTGIPQLISDMKANPILTSLFPKYALGDISGSQVSQQIFEQYAQDFLKNLSYDITMTYRYKGQAEQEIADNYKQAMADARFIKENSMGAAANPGVGGGGTHASADDMGNSAASSAYRGLFESVVKDLTGTEADSVSVGMGGTGTSHSSSMTESPSLEGGGMPGAPAKFNWRERSQQICDQITARGYKAKDFGCMENVEETANRDPNFSWRGYSRMICNRLQTIYDTSVPEMCGCPPPTWPGWKQ